MLFFSRCHSLLFGEKHAVSKAAVEGTQTQGETTGGHQELDPTTDWAISAVSHLVMQKHFLHILILTEVEQFYLVHQ